MIEAIEEQIRAHGLNANQAAQVRHSLAVQKKLSASAREQVALRTEELIQEVRRIISADIRSETD